MRFPLRRRHPPEAIMERISRIEDQFQPETPAKAEEAFESPGIPYAWRQPPSGEMPSPPSFRTIQPLPLPPPHDEPPSALPAAGIRLREQSTSADAQAGRLVRQVRDEVEQLKNTLESLTFDRDEMFELDIEALVADPEHATTLPPAVLVRAVVEAAEEAKGLREKLQAEQEKRLKLQRRMRELRRADAARQARLDALEQVIAALHANLEDLRLERDRTRLAGVQPVHALRPGPGQLPQGGSSVSSCE